MRLRKLSELGFPVGSDVIAAVAAIEASGGRHTHDSGHAVGPTWIYTFPAQHDAQVALRINRRKLSVYLRANPHGRTDFEPQVQRFGQVEQVYPNPDEKPANSLLSEEHAPFLTPRRGRLLRLAVDNTQFKPMLRAYLHGAPATRAEDPANGTAADGTARLAEVNIGGGGGDAGRAPLSPEALRRQLDRNDATGRAGERLAYADEIARLSALGCPDPAAHVRVMAESDVAAGYDIRSSWNGETRCIEVKSSGDTSNDFFVTANERETLSRLAGDAWLYRVRVDSDLGGEVVQRVQDPMVRIPDASMQAVVWRVDAAALPDDAPGEDA